MAHPIMFDDDDPILVRLRDIALALPEAYEKVSHGRPTFCCGRQFICYGGGPKGGERVDAAMIFKPDPAEATALADDERFFVPAYYGPGGWLGLDLARPDTDWTEVAELVDASYRQIAPKRAIKVLDA